MRRNIVALALLFSFVSSCTLKREILDSKVSSITKQVAHIADSSVKTRELISDMVIKTDKSIEVKEYTTTIMGDTIDSIRFTQIKIVDKTTANRADNLIERGSSRLNIAKDRVMQEHSTVVQQTQREGILSKTLTQILWVFAAVVMLIVIIKLIIK